VLLPQRPALFGRARSQGTGRRHPLITGRVHDRPEMAATFLTLCHHFR
jgi:hypothetical protein